MSSGQRISVRTVVQGRSPGYRSRPVGLVYPRPPRDGGLPTASSLNDRGPSSVNPWRRPVRSTDRCRKRVRVRSLRSHGPCSNRSSTELLKRVAAHRRDRGHRRASESGTISAGVVSLDSYHQYLYRSRVPASASVGGRIRTVGEVSLVRDPVGLPKLCRPLPRNNHNSARVQSD
jgi:hypothetical protein